MTRAVAATGRRERRRGVDGDERIAFVFVFFRVADVAGDAWATTTGPEGCDRDRHRSYQGCISVLETEKTWVFRPPGKHLFFCDLCERVRDVRKTDCESYVCVRDVIG